MINYNEHTLLHWYMYFITICGGERSIMKQQKYIRLIHYLRPNERKPYKSSQFLILSNKGLFLISIKLRDLSV